MSSLIAVGIVLSQMSAQQLEAGVTLEQLKNAGVNSDAVISLYQETHNIELKEHDTLRVTQEEEGHNLRFDTLDGYSVSVPIELMASPFNKDFPVR